MEYCVVEGKRKPKVNPFVQRSSVKKLENITIAAIHKGYVGNFEQDCSNPTLIEVFEFRVEHLIEYILDELESSGNIHASVESAFKRMDLEVLTRLKSSCSWEEELFLAYQQTALNSLVVILRKGRVYLAGSVDAKAVLSRKSQPLYLHNPGRFRPSVMCKPTPTPRVDSPKFVELQVEHDDAYIALVSTQIFKFLKHEGEFLPVLQTRINTLGLVEACKSVVGRYEDLYSKVLVVITLQRDAHLPLNFRGAGTVANYSSQVTLNTDFGAVDPLRFLLPLRDGRNQTPEPQTSSSYSTFMEVQQPCEKDLYVLTSLDRVRDHKRIKIDS